jgi:hypothetical protein
MAEGDWILPFVLVCLDVTLYILYDVTVKLMVYA